MARGTSRNGGSQSPGANLTSNDAHEHVIHINLQEEAMNQQETWKWNPISAITSCIFSIALKLISLSRASGSSAAVTCAVEMNRVSLPPRPLLNNQNSPISSFQDLQQEALLITNQRKLPDSVRAYFSASDQLQDATRGLGEIVMAVLEGWTSTSCSREKLAASTAALEEVVNKVKAAVHQNQSPMQIKQSDGKILDAELSRINHRKNIYRAIFTFLAGFFGAGSVFAIKVHPLWVAVPVGVFAAVASVVSLAVGYWIESHQDELKIRVENRKDITNAITEACMFALEDLHDIEELASTLKSHTGSMLGTVDSGATVSDVVVTKIKALKQGFKQLKSKVGHCSKNANSKRQALLINILNKLD